MNLPWVCEDCDHTWVDSPFVTYEVCPRCKRYSIGHGYLVMEDISSNERDKT